MRLRRLTSLSAIALVLAGCLPVTANSGAEQLRGSYTVGGGGAALEAVHALVSGFVKRHPKVRWEIQDVGSRAGMDLLSSGGLDLAMSSLTPEAERGNLQVVSLGTTGVGIAVNPNNPVKGLTREQVRDIFSGRTKNWAAVGGRSGEILVAIRQDTSAIRMSFTSYFFDAETSFAKEAIVLLDLRETLIAVRSLSNMVTMVRISSETRDDPSIRLLPIDGVAATRENVMTGAYGAQRPLYLVYNSAAVKPAVRAFIDYAQTSEGRALMASNGP